MARRITRKKKVVRRKATKRKRNVHKNVKRYVLPSLLALCILVIIIFLVRSCFREPESFESDKYFVKGIDVSHHNPILNWQSVLDENITFAYMKSTEGTSHIDRNYIYNYELAKGTNLIVGSYHFYTFALSGKEQAQHFLANTKFDTGDLFPAIDVEHSSVNVYSKDKKNIDLVIKELKILENELYEYFGIRPIIYTNKDCYKLYIKGHFPDNVIWMCDLHNEPSDDITNWHIWQFSHKGELPGVDGHIDLNYYRYTFDEFRELLLP